MITLEKTLHGEDLFDSLQSEKEKPSKKFRTKKDELSQLVREFRIFSLFSKALEDLSEPYRGDELKAIQKIFSESKGYSSREIKRFLLMLSPYKKEHQDFAFSLGLYLNFLMDSSPDKSFVIPLSHLDYEDGPQKIGYKNKDKKITIKGEVGDNLGENMTGGRIEVFGGALYSPGYYMKDGTIIIHGDVADELCEGMSGGEVYVYGDAGEDVGINMKGGKLFLVGNFISHGNAQGGDIYHKGKLIVKDGRPIK